MSKSVEMGKDHFYTRTMKDSGKSRKLTGNDGFGSLQPRQHMLDQTDFGAGLQIADTLLEDGDEHAPNFGLQVGRAVVQQFQHVFHVLGVLDDKVQLHVELTADELQEREEEERFPVSV